jgi:multidrug efflux pump subunit AcrA (membrane-fusion protein)
MNNQLFLEAADRWYLNKLYVDLNCIKQKQLNIQGLTSLEATILRGLLCGYNSKAIASKLPEYSPESIVKLIRALHGYIEALIGEKLPPKKILDSLEVLGYKINLHSKRKMKKLSHTKSEKQEQEDNIPFINTTVEQIEQKSLPSNNSHLLPIQKIDNIDNKVTKQQLSNALLETKLGTKSPQTHVIETETASKDELLNSDRLNLSSTKSVGKITPTNYLPIVAENDFLPPISRWTTLGGLFLVSTIAITIATSAFTPYNLTVKAEAKVRPAGELRIVQAQTEGKIVKIPVSENQLVKQGDAIALIDNSRFQTTKIQLENKIQQAHLQIQQINTQIQTQQRQIIAESERIENTIASETAVLNRTYREYQDKKITSIAGVEEAKANLQLSEEELEKTQAKLKSARANQKSTEATLNAAKSKLNRYQNIASSGALSQDLLEEARLAVEQQQQSVTAQIATVEEQQQAIEQQQQAVAAAKARLESVKAALNPSDADLAIATKNITKEQAIGKANLASLNGEKEALIQQRLEIEKQLQEDQSELAQVKRELDRTIIKAPTDGIVFQLNLRNSDQTVTTGEKIAQIVPSQNSLAVETLVAAGDISKVKIGQPTQIKISACPYPDYGTLKGKVSKIAPDIIAPENNPNNVQTVSNISSPNTNNSFYAVTIAPDSLFLSQSNKKCPLQLGMEGQADIIANRETVLQFVLRKARLATDL